MENKNNLLKDYGLNEKVSLILTENPGLRAGEIAEKLNIDRKQINSFLYKSPKDKYIQDEKYCWYLAQDVPVQRSDKKNISENALSRLCKYYLSCLSQDNENGISVFADSKFGLDYIELEKLSLDGGEHVLLSNEGQGLLGKIRKDRSRLEMYLGYPTALKKVKSNKNSWEGFFVEPILLFPIELSEGNPKVSQGFPIINLSVLKRFSNMEKEQIMDELVQLEEELGLSDGKCIPEIDELALRLRNIRPEWPWEEDIDPDNLCSQSSLRIKTKEGIYNRGVVLIAERSPFTQGLESELKSLANLPLSNYENTALGQWLGGQVIKKDVEMDSKLPLLEVLSLNSEQRLAVHHSLTDPLTIVTGPPGTGKSQVVTDLLINAAWQGKKILFASKNNQAVDVVEARINNLGTRPILLRMGSVQYQLKLAEYLIGLLTATSTEQDQENFVFNKKKYEQLEEKYFQLDRQEIELIQLRNKIDELDQYIERIRCEISKEIFDRLKIIDLNQFEEFVLSFKPVVENANKNKQSIWVRLFWDFIKDKRFKKIRTEFEEYQPVVLSLGINYPGDVNEKNINSWNDLIGVIEKSLLIARDVQEYLALLKDMDRINSLETISKEKAGLTKQLADNAENLWKGWLGLQPSRLSGEDRLSLNRYNSLLRMVLDSGGDLYSKLGRKIYSEYSNLSVKVSHLLPVWAVTSLSARGKIPLEPGYFDIVVFDESSQCDIASALPLLYRAKRAVIIGDPMQLRHISGIPKKQDWQMLEKYNLIPDFVHWGYSENSLYDLASGLSQKGSVITLLDHHRSHADIIGFSSVEFYKKHLGVELRVATNYDKLKFPYSKEEGIRWVNVSGKAIKPANASGAINEEEANLLVNEIRKLVENNYVGEIGVVTPFRAQANLIRKIISEDNNLSTKLFRNNFLVDVVHKFQGDQRDVMFFSPVLSKNMPFGAELFLKNNGNLFNVAITRARAMLIVVGDQNAALDCDVSYLKNFAIYVQKINCKKEEEQKILINELGEEYPIVTHPEYVSEWERILYKALYKEGIKTIPQYQIDKYTLDLALFNEGRMLDIEVDGEHYHRNWTGELCRRDQIRNQRLFELDWDVKRFWVYEVRDNLDDCVKKIVEWKSGKK